jgi:hypothetical protein
MEGHLDIPGFPVYNYLGVDAIDNLKFLCRRIDYLKVTMSRMKAMHFYMVFEAPNRIHLELIGGLNENSIHSIEFGINLGEKARK